MPSTEEEDGARMLEMIDEGWRDDRRFNERELGGVRKHEKRGGRL